MNLRIFDSADELHVATARTLLQRLQPETAIALSGGSTPRALYTMLGRDPWRSSLAESKITWVVVDERFVPINDPQSNAGMIGSTLFAHGLPPGHRFLRFRPELGSPQRAADAFIEEWQSLGLTTLDVILLGMGDDGHTASLFPGTPVLEVSDRLACAVYVEKLSMWRLTLTKPPIVDAKLRLVTVAGASKATVLREVRDGADYPIAQVTRGEGETWWLVDRAAAADL